MPAYPESLMPPDGIAPVPRRLRGLLGGVPLFDTERALYVWEFPPYPQYYIPLDDLDADLLIDERRSENTPRGTATRWALRVGELTRPGAVLIHGDDAPERLRRTARSTGTRSTRGSRRTSRSTCTPATRTPGWTRSAPAGRCGSSCPAWCWPRRPRRLWPACPRWSSTAVGGRRAVAEAVRDADIVAVMVPDSPDVEEVLAGENGVFDTVAKGTLSRPRPARPAS